jgi:hypothetical protein
MSVGSPHGQVSIQDIHGCAHNFPVDFEMIDHFERPLSDLPSPVSEWMMPMGFTHRLALDERYMVGLFDAQHIAKLIEAEFGIAMLCVGVIRNW